MILKSRLFTAAVLSILASFSACSSVEEMEAERSPYIQITGAAPPENLYEDTLIPNDPVNEAWRPGFWSYNGLNFNWIPGSIILKPHPTAVWSGDRWERRAYGWAFLPGYWQ